MQFSQKSKEIIDSCRFCWMCRHVCPIGNVTGQERNTARARALSLSLVVRGAADFSADLIDNVYECALCGGCTNNCMTGWDPIKFTKEARREAAVEGLLPNYIEKLIDNIQKTGNVYGAKKLDAKLSAAIDKLPKKADTLLFLGADARYKSPKNAINAIELLSKAGVKFTVLKDEPDSGYALDFLTSETEETKETMKKAAAALGFKTIVAYDPCDAKVFIREYKEWNIGLKADVVTFTSFLAKLIAEKKLKPAKSKNVYTFQDPALLARDLEESQPARDIIAACGEVSEMLINRNETMWAGSTLMAQYMPEVMALVAEKRWHNAADADILVTACPGEYETLKAVKPKSKKLMTIEEIVLDLIK